MTHTITGHIDGLRIHSSSIHVIDDKPNPNKEKPIAQLMVYARQCRGGWMVPSLPCRPHKYG